MSVKERDVKQFQQALKIYTDATCSQISNLQYVLQSASVPVLEFKFVNIKLSFSLSSSWLLVFLSRTCQTDHVSSCMSFGRIVSPGWGRIRRVSWNSILVYREWMLGISWNLCNTPSCSQAISRVVSSLQGKWHTYPFCPSFLSATSSRPSVRPSRAALSIPWKSQRWSPPCCSQVETTLWSFNLSYSIHKLSH